MKLNHKDQAPVALISGASSGIGKAIAFELVKHGYHLVLNGRNPEKLALLKEALLEKNPECSCILMPGDVSQSAFCQTLVEQSIANFGRLDVLINNAGIAGKIGLLTEVPVSEIEQTLDTNLKGPIFMMQEALRQWMVPNQSGVIININSIAGKTAYPYWSVYDASKFGLRAITEAVAEEQKLNNIKVIGIYPGAVATPLWDQVDMDQAPNLDGMLDVETVAEAVWFALNQPAKAFVSEITVTPLKPAL